ncbi:hypothetical protein H310_12357 [Aphanomyces invadans]|uniref:DDE Tnp4 domain-containing protein n=1 Tax=Aphanomyces invadans TaxID=157072 RepID=A0A024TIB3_9STRA|nr:hypothetical protein H310_12357 [Aphanomyces invadans]ETV93793.1 hypothetical protein H310_12357 [Aphanomyces invadans]|eukprot:XP_008877602.1 hypothetical protein H310_12357 [Aphanomyces invadans]
MQSEQQRLIHRSRVPLRLKFALLRRRGHSAQLTIPNVNFTLETFTDADCLAKFRFSKTTLRSLVSYLRIPPRVITPERTACTGVEALCILLRRFAVPDRWSDLVTMFGRSRSGLCNIFLHVLDHIYSKFAEIIYLDRDRISTKLPQFSQSVVAKGAEVHNVWAFIDGTVRECCRPEVDERQRTVYNGHKRRHAVKFQTLVTPDGIIAHAYGPIEGRRHDLTILRRSDSESVIAGDDRFRGFIVYGDPAYGYPDQLASPFGGARLTDAQRKVNKSMSRVRISVEWSFGQVLQYWPIVDFKKKMRIGNSPISKMYKVAVLLTNCITCDRGRNTNSAYFGLPPPSLEEYLHVNNE